MLEETMREAMRATLEINQYLTATNEYAPEYSTGTSEDEIVDVTVDRQGKLVECVIAEDWSRVLDPAALENSLNDALTQAQSYRMETVQAKLDQEDFRPSKITDEEIEVAIEESTRQALEQSSFYPPRDIAEVAEDTIKLLDASMTSTPTKPSVVTAHVDTLSGLATRIEINPDWAERRGGSVIARAIVLAANQVQSTDDHSDKLMAESLGFFTNWSK